MLPEQQSELDRRIGQCIAIREAAARVYSRYLRTAKPLTAAADRIAKVQEYAILVSIGVGAVVYLAGYPRTALLPAALAAVVFGLLNWRHSRRERRELGALTAEMEELKQQWANTGALASSLDEYGLLLVDQESGSVHPSRAQDAERWWNMVEGQLRRATEKHGRH